MCHHVESIIKYYCDNRQIANNNTDYLFIGPTWTILLKQFLIFAKKVWESLSFLLCHRFLSEILTFTFTAKTVSTLLIFFLLQTFGNKKTLFEKLLPKETVVKYLGLTKNTFYLLFEKNKTKMLLNLEFKLAAICNAFDE
jgi:hypothetical protein